jgi:hypothetical protein
MVLPCTTPPDMVGASPRCVGVERGLGFEGGLDRCRPRLQHSLERGAPRQHGVGDGQALCNGLRSTRATPQRVRRNKPQPHPPRQATSPPSTRPHRATATASVQPAAHPEHLVFVVQRCTTVAPGRATSGYATARHDMAKPVTLGNLNELLSSGARPSSTDSAPATTTATSAAHAAPITSQPIIPARGFSDVDSSSEDEGTIRQVARRLPSFQDGETMARLFSGTAATAPEGGYLTSTACAPED